MRKAVRDILQDHLVLTQQLARIRPEYRHLAQRVDGVEIHPILRTLGFGIDLNEPGIASSFVQRNARRHRTGKRREIEIHDPLLRD